MITMVVFDMAGTTVDEDNLVYKMVQRAINEHGFDFSLSQVLAEGAGKEKRDAINSVLQLNGVRDESLSGLIFQRFRQLLADAYDTEPIREQPNASALFMALRERDVFVVLNTGYDRPTAMKLISKIGWKFGKDFDDLVTATDVQRGRPNPDMIQKAMNLFAVTDPLNVIKVGDSVIDIEEGKNAGCRLTVGITSGAHSVQQLESAHPDHIIDDLIELLPIIDEN